jgi:hypothetical protein
LIEKRASKYLFCKVSLHQKQFVWCPDFAASGQISSEKPSRQRAPRKNPETWFFLVRLLHLMQAIIITSENWGKSSDTEDVGEHLDGAAMGCQSHAVPGKE